MNQLKENLKNESLYVWTEHKRINIDLIFIKKFATKIKELRVNYDKNFNYDDIKNKIKYLASSNVQVCLLLIYSKRFFKLK